MGATKNSRPACIAGSFDVQLLVDCDILQSSHANAVARYIFLLPLECPEFAQPNEGACKLLPSQMIAKLTPNAIVKLGVLYLKSGFMLKMGGATQDAYIAFNISFSHTT
ncbi:hypothetical protein ACJX0J_012861, partial [Zea mays]